MSIDLFTARYQQFQPGMGVPVRTSLGAPRWRLKYDLRHYVPEVTPERSFLRAPIDVFTAAYRAKLERSGVEHLATRFRQIVDAEKEARLVILCFEDLTKPGEWCHRRIFAEWWQEQTGDAVRELGPTQPTADPFEQRSLL